MARIRTIKPGAFSSESLCAVSVDARWHFAGLWTYCDDEGRGKANPRLIKAAVWPLDDDKTPAEVERLNNELEREGMLRRYVVDGVDYIQVINWSHQKISHPTPSVLPEPPPEEASVSIPEDSGKPLEDSALIGIGIGIKEEEKDSCVDFDAAKAAKARVPRPPDLLWDALMESCGITGKIPESAKGAYGKARKDLAAIGATPNDIKLRARRYAAKWPNASLTPTALARRWAELEPGSAPADDLATQWAR